MEFGTPKAVEDLPPLTPDAVVDLSQERKDARTDEILNALDDDLIGLVPVKTRIREIASLLLVDRLRARFGLTSAPPNLHMCFTGSPGTGKTTVAVRMAELLHGLGHIRKNHLVTASRDDLVGQHVGHTAPKTRDVLRRAMGGVLFIDEAYALHRDSDRDYGQEAIEILLQFMENHREDLVVILAGYRDRMDEFFAVNPGMSSRVAHHIDFPDFDLAELESIGRLMLAENGYALATDAEPVFRDYLALRSTQPRFANARSVRNAIERARLRHANRLTATTDRVGRADLMTLRPEDFLASRVFATERPEPGTPT
ncbi:AAA family ATPase [Actinocorallia longicatena]|uniref:CbbX protein n=1 Tax=Actinocorallia longicatena TaxID=111803 RepID=A0ABP6QBV3_9ACTN